MERTEGMVIVCSHRFLSPARGLVVVLGVSCIIRAIPPKWIADREVLEGHLRDRYDGILRTAVSRGCESLQLPLLGAMEEGINRNRCWPLSGNV